MATFVPARAASNAGPTRPAELPPPALRADPSELVDLGPLDAPDFGPCVRSGESVAARLERRTRPLVGRPYADSPLGEGDGPDDDPRIRFDAFDCTTWVETAIALAACDDRTLRERLDAIRYREARVTFEDRRHLVTSQWVPGLEALGLIERATARAFPVATQAIALRLGPDRWQGRRIARTLELPDAAVPTGRYQVEYVPVGYVRTSSATFAPGTLINVVRVDWYLSPDVVTHQGMVLDVDGERVVRHASLRARRVIDEPLRGFVARFSKPRKWPIAGFQLLEISDGSGRSERAPSAAASSGSRSP